MYLLQCFFRKTSHNLGPNFYLKTSLYRDRPARWVGIEMNEFNVAKTLVVSRMIARSGVPLESVLQVWWSSVWTKETLKFFLDTVDDILRAGFEEELYPFRKDHKSKFLAECRMLRRDPLYAESRPFFLPNRDNTEVK